MMMKKQVLLAVAALALSGAASAQGYGVVSAGVSKLGLDCDGATLCDKTDTAFKLLGGYKFNPNLAAEAGYFSFGKARAGDSVSTGTVNTTAFGGGMAFHQDFAADWNFVARLGLAQVKTKLGGDAAASGSDNNVQAYAGLGVGYKLSKSMSVDLSFDTTKSKFNKNDVDTSGNVSSFNIGMTFGF